MEEIVFPLVLSLIAGSATGVGGLIVLFFGKINEKVLGFFMGFAGGVMLIISLLNLFIEALSLLSYIYVTLAFAFGALIMMGIDLTLPHIEMGRWEGVKDVRLLQSGLVIALGMSLHNFPEGLVISAGYEHMPRLGILVAIMICFHNIPEGIATVIPLRQAGVSMRRAIGLSLLSGMVEPLGALLGSALIFGLRGNTTVIGLALGFASGVMTYITIDELIPIAHEYCSRIHKHIVSTGLLAGMIFAQLLSILLNV
jgi:ZIP family zinc transporter